MDISNDARVSETLDCFVNNRTGSMGGVENVEIRIFWTRAIVVGGRIGASVKWHGVNMVTLAPSPFKTSLVLMGLVADIGGSFRLPLVIDKDEGVVLRVSSVELLPYSTRILRTVWVINKRVREERGVVSSRGDAVNKRNFRGNKWVLWFLHVIRENVGDVGDEEEVEYDIVVLNVNVKGFIVKALIGKGGNGRE